MDKQALLERRGNHLGTFVNKWRGRYVSIWADRVDEAHVISVGTPIGKPVGTCSLDETVVCVESRADYAGTLQRIADAGPMQYVYE